MDLFIVLFMVCHIVWFLGPFLLALCDLVLATYLSARFMSTQKRFFLSRFGIGLCGVLWLAGYMYERYMDALSVRSLVLLPAHFVLLVGSFPILALCLCRKRARIE